MHPDFEHLTFAQELSLCQRYYAQSYGYGVTTKSFNQSYEGMIYFTGTGNYGMSVQNGVFPVEMSRPHSNNIWSCWNCK